MLLLLALNSGRHPSVANERQMPALLSYLGVNAALASAGMLLALFLGFPRNLMSHWTEFALALWVSSMFVERLIVDLATIKYPKKLGKQFEGEKGKRQYRRRLVRAALKDPSAYGFFILSFPLLALALLLNRQRIEYLVAIGQWLLERIENEIWDTLAFIGLLFLLLIYRKSRSTGSMVGVAKVWVEEARGRAKDILLLLEIIFVLLVGTVILRLLTANIGEDPRIREIVEGWRDSNLIVTANAFLYLWVYYREIKPYVPKKDRGWFWAGFFKDATIYSLAALFIANGLDRFRYALRYLEPKDMWTVFKFFAGFTSFVAIIGIAMDLLYVGAHEKKHGLYREYSMAGPRAIMRFHIYFRFIVLFTIPLIAWFSYLAAQVANATLR